MNIIVCIKQVPENASVSISSEFTLVREGISMVINPSDANALESALQFKDTYGATVTVISMGKPSAEAMLKQLAPLGVDKMVLISDKAFAGADTYATALVLTKAIEYLGGADIILCGRRAIDGETGQVGPEIAAMSNIPCVTNCLGINCADNKALECIRLLEHEQQIILVTTPALITVCEWINSPRLPSILSLRRCNNTKVEIITNKQLGISSDLCGLKGSPTQVKKIYVRQIGKKNPPKYYDAQLGAKAAVEHILRIFNSEVVK